MDLMKDAMEFSDGHVVESLGNEGEKEISSDDGEMNVASTSNPSPSHPYNLKHCVVIKDCRYDEFF